MGIDPETQEVLIAEAFEHWGKVNSHNCVHFYKALQNLPSGTIIAIAVSDEASDNLRELSKEILGEEMGSKEIFHLGFRESFAFIGVKGDPTQAKEMRNQRGKDRFSYVFKEF